MDDVLVLFGGRAQPVMTHLIESGKLSLEGVKNSANARRICRVLGWRRDCNGFWKSSQFANWIFTSKKYP
jgi:hypothetical protein